MLRKIVFTPRAWELLAIFTISAAGPWIAAADTSQAWRAEMAEMQKRFDREIDVLQHGTPAAQGVEFYIATTSTLEVESATKAGNLDALINAGRMGLPAGYGPLIALEISLLKDGEVRISATSSNFKGRMGSREVLAYLTFPEVVAGSEMRGFVASPGTYTASSSAISISSLPSPAPSLTQSSNAKKVETEIP
ncbi:hypothetical protein B9Z19DRAFT_1194165 [Tuber borchii]|uniref:Aconitase/3-isopropylmalate dehydratase large subunit alpha/beta/alpha domain-containing protein n=1 Tax=Tuber borchii TaxID=42251 RepID=A0A2T6ZP68_TUBBO|nr:hypothetical protein B9Z19DRAFT_1194165 [Tuber borchii]